MPCLSARSLQLLTLLVSSTLLSTPMCERFILLIEQQAPASDPAVTLPALFSLLLGCPIRILPGGSGNVCLSDGQRRPQLSDILPGRSADHEAAWASRMAVFRASAAAICRLEQQHQGLMRCANQSARKVLEQSLAQSDSTRSVFLASVGFLALHERATSFGLVPKDDGEWVGTAVRAVLAFLECWVAENSRFYDARRAALAHALTDSMEWPPISHLPDACPRPEWALACATADSSLFTTLVAALDERLRLLVNAPLPEATPANHTGAAASAPQGVTLRAVMMAVAGLVELSGHERLVAAGESLSLLCARLVSTGKRVLEGDDMMHAVQVECTKLKARLRGRRCHAAE